MQQKNFVIFLTLSLLILYASFQVQTWLWPPPKPKPMPKKLPASWLVSDVLARTPAAFSLAPAGIGQACQLAAAYQMAGDPQVAALPAARDAAQLAAAPKPPEPKKEPPKAPPPAPNKQAPHEEIALGGPGYNLQVVLTSRGAAVQSLILTQFQAADEMGRPVPDESLHLIPQVPDHNIFSNVLYHYGAADDDRPWDSLGTLEWTVESKEVGPDATAQKVVFVADVPGLDGLRLRKIYTLEPRTYHLGLAIEMTRAPAAAGAAKTPLKFRYQLTSGHGLPIEGVWYTNTFRNALIGTTDPNGDAYRDYQDARTISYQDGGNDVRKKPDRRLQYAGIAVQYFASVIVVDDQQEKRDFLASARPTLVNGQRDAEKQYLDDIIARVVSEPVELEPGESKVHRYLLYNGPVKVRLLSQLRGKGEVDRALIDRYENVLQLRTLTDYQSPGRLGDFASSIKWTWVIIQCTNLMHSVLFFLHNYIMPWSYGLCVILLTLLVRGMMFPISRRQALTSIKMQALAPELKKLQEKFKTDPQARNVAMMDLYRKHGVHPLGSCWIVMLQMPIFMGLYYCLQESIMFRLAPFAWIVNLAAPDMLISWGQSIPWISDPKSQGNIFYLGPYFNLLPVIAVALMLVQQKLMTPPAMDEQQEMQQKMMKYMMVFMGLMFYKVAAGLCVYFIVSSLWGMTERKLLPKAKPATTPPSASGGGGGRGDSRKPTPPRPKTGGGSKGGGGPRPNGDGVVQKVKEMWAEVLKQAKKK